VDVVVAMGGPMSVNDEAEHPWLVQEKAWLRDALHRELPVIGVCLGAQCMASALGARISAAPEREIGWWPVRDIRHRNSDPLPVLHWHGETFDLPEGAIHLECSEGCPNQSFQWGERAIGMQYHVEVTAESLNSLIEHSRHELMPGTYVQTEEQIRKGFLVHQFQVARRLDQLMTRLLATEEQGLGPNRT
jgi:GMP synthase-like glutamine amidotransferase